MLGAGTFQGHQPPSTSIQAGRASFLHIKNDMRPHGPLKPPEGGLEVVLPLTLESWQISRPSGLSQPQGPVSLETHWRMGTVGSPWSLLPVERLAPCALVSVSVLSGFFEAVFTLCSHLGSPQVREHFLLICSQFTIPPPKL